MKKGTKNRKSSIPAAPQKVAGIPAAPLTYLQKLSAYYALANGELEKLSAGIQRYIIEINQAPLLTIDFILLTTASGKAAQQALALELIAKHKPQTFNPADAADLPAYKLATEDGKGRVLSQVWLRDAKHKRFLRKTNNPKRWVTVPYTVIKTLGLKPEAVK